MVAYYRNPDEVKLAKSAVRAINQMSWLKNSDRIIVDLVMMYAGRIDKMNQRYEDDLISEETLNNGLHQATTKLTSLLDRIGGSTRARQSLDTATEDKVSAVDELKNRRKMKRTGTE